MKKLYFIAYIFTVFIAPIVVISTSGLISWCFIGAQLTTLMIMLLMKKTRKEVHKSTRDGVIKSMLYNTFASEKEKKLNENTDWVKVVGSKYDNK